MSDENTEKDYVQYPLRVTREFRDKLKSSAQDNNRSLMSEILTRLEFSYKYDAWAKNSHGGPGLFAPGPEDFENYAMTGGDGPSIDDKLKHTVQEIAHQIGINDHSLAALNERVGRIERLLKAMPSWQDTEG